MHSRTHTTARGSIARVLLCHALAASFTAACVKLPRHAPSTNGTGLTDARADTSGQTTARVNLNTATGEELERLPGVGPETAARILEHRRRYGAFRRAEHLLLVRGISEQRFKQLRALVTVE